MNADKIHEKELDKTGFWGKKGAGCIIYAEDTKKFCIPFRSKEVEEPHTWGTWGGAIDPKEDIEEALKREVNEEAGYTGKIKTTPLLLFKHKSGFQYQNFLVVVEKQFTPKLDWETDKAGWFEFGKWPKPLHPGLKALLADKKSLTKIKKVMTQIENSSVTTINILLVTNVASIDTEPAYFHAFEMCHKVNAMCQRMEVGNDIIITTLQAQSNRIGTRLPKAIEALGIEYRSVPNTGSIDLDILIAITEDQDNELTTKINNLMADLEAKGIVVAQAKVPPASKQMENTKIDNPIKLVREFKPKVEPNPEPYGGEFDIKERFYRDGKVKKLGDIGPRFLFDYTTTVNPWNAVNMWPMI